MQRQMQQMMMAQPYQDMQYRRPMQQPMPGLQGLAGLLQGLRGIQRSDHTGQPMTPKVLADGVTIAPNQFHEANPVMGNRPDGTPIRLIFLLITTKVSEKSPYNIYLTC